MMSNGKRKAPKKKRPMKKLTRRELVVRAKLGQMRRKEYLAALEKLGLTVASKKTSEAFGIGLRQCQRIASGKVSVPAPVAKLLGMYLQHGLQDAA